MTLSREITETFANVIEMKNKYIKGHSFRVAKYTTMLTKAKSWGVSEQGGKELLALRGLEGSILGSWKVE
jgi:HD-GYP domain-containing protein (c-di-GMP phosphodiesterase class II)